MSNRLLLLGLFLSSFGLHAWAGHTLSPQEQKVVHAWLVQHAGYRLATDADCKCAKHIREMKAGSGGVWKPVPDYRPYVATGDFNGDGVTDFAVEVIDQSKSPNDFVLLVFNGPFRSGSTPTPVFVQSGVDGKALFFGPPRPKPYRLAIGPFDSDNSAILMPQGNTYRLEAGEEN